MTECKSCRGVCSCPSARTSKQDFYPFFFFCFCIAAIRLDIDRARVQNLSTRSSRTALNRSHWCSMSQTSIKPQIWILSWHLMPSKLLFNSAFANSCLLQTDTFLFPRIHSYNIFKQVWKVKWKTGPINTMYGVPHEVTFKVKLAIIQTRVFFTLKRNTYGCVLIQYLSYIYVQSYLVCRWKCLKYKKREKWSMHTTKDKRWRFMILNRPRK